MKFGSRHVPGMCQGCMCFPCECSNGDDTPNGWLVLERKVGGEGIVIVTPGGEKIRLRVRRTKPGRAWLAIQAKAEVKVWREEHL